MVKLVRSFLVACEYPVATGPGGMTDTDVRQK